MRRDMAHGMPLGRSGRFRGPTRPLAHPGVATMEKALAAWLLLSVSTTATPASPTQVVQSAVERAVQVAQDEDLARPTATERRRSEMRRIAERAFDFSEMARRSLARHWWERTPQQREEFSRIFAELLGRAYFGRLENYAAERIVYTGETVEGEFATVRSKIIAGRRGEIPVEYRLHLVGPRWAVYDVVIEGVSLINSYRSQFNKVIQSSSYDELVRQLRGKGADLVTPAREAR